MGARGAGSKMFWRSFRLTVPPGLNWIYCGLDTLHSTLLYGQEPNAVCVRPRWEGGHDRFVSRFLCLAQFQGALAARGSVCCMKVLK